MQTILSFLKQFNPQTQAALIAAAVAVVTTVLTIILATPLRYFLDKRALRFKLYMEYNYEQRKKLRELLGSYHGRFLQSATNLNYRIWNLYKNEREGWLKVNGCYENSGYYYVSTVHRFLAFFVLVRQFEKEAIIVDQRIAEETDLDLIKYIKALIWAVTDVTLFDGISYDTSEEKDHLFVDKLRMACDMCNFEDGIMELSEFELLLQQDECLDIVGVLQFFDGLNASEDRIRWDRLLAFDLLLMAFINTIGYEMQKSDDDRFLAVANRICHKEVLRNLKDWLPKLGLHDQPSASLVKKAITRSLRERMEKNA